MTARAGWAETEITPPLGLPMGGRGPRFTPGASVLDPLIAQAFILEDAKGGRTLWVSMDQIGLARGAGEALRHELSGLTGIPLDAVILNFSHTHSGPMATFDGYAVDTPKPEALRAYEAERDGKVLRVACRALERMQPVAVTRHAGRSDIGINRRRRDRSGAMGMAPNPDGLHIPDLWALDVAAERGQDRCVLFSYACHPVIVYGFAWDGISADYPGVCRRRLWEHLGAQVHCQFFQGMAGNIRPRVLADLKAGRFRKSTPEDPEAAGAQLAQDILAALEDGGERLTPDLRAAAGTFLAQRDPKQVPTLEHWVSVAQEDDELRRNLGRYWMSRISSGLPPVQAVPWDIGLLRLTRDHRIAWMAGEAVAEWLGHLRRWLRDDRLTAWGYCQNATGYLTTDELIPEGGYEVGSSPQFARSGPGPFAVGLNEAARRQFLSLARQIE